MTAGVIHPPTCPLVCTPLTKESGVNSTEEASHLNLNSACSSPVLIVYDLKRQCLYNKELRAPIIMAGSRGDRT